MRFYKYHVPCLVIICCMFMAGCELSESNNDNLIITTRSGKIKGYEENATYAFLGIPYAAPPVDELRWKPPVQEAAWEGVLDCTRYGNAPIQPTELDMGQGVEISEDCLYLNVWTPDTDKNAGLPVMFWICGGEYTYGTGSQPEYAGVNLASSGVVVITINYRLNVFGFLVNELLYAEQGHAGNYGLMDMIAALEWVRDNIENFGGDPDNVTIFGESAGGSSVSHLMGSEAARGLFHKVICQSGSSLGDYYALGGLTGSWEEAAWVGATFQGALGCQTLAEMRAKNASEVYTTAFDLGIYYGPVIDGVILTDSWKKNLENSGTIDLMIGTMAQDGWGFNAPITSVQDYEDHAQSLFHNQTQDVLTIYPADTAEQAAIQDAVTSTTAGFTQPARYIAKAVEAQNLNVYRYVCRFTPPTEQGALFGCYHSAELAYVFGNLFPEKGYGPEDKPLSETMMGYWTNFARTGNPNAASLPDWPIYTTQTPILVIDADQYPVINELQESDCDFFAAIQPDAQPDYPAVWE